MSEFKKKKSRMEHTCSQCGKKIKKGEFYYCEEKFLANLHKSLMKICIKCFKKWYEFL